MPDLVDNRLVVHGPAADHCDPLRPLGSERSPEWRIWTLRNYPLPRQGKSSPISDGQWTGTEPSAPGETTIIENFSQE
jgi:hypothetical protein